jgi:hypothetical protein
METNEKNEHAAVFDVPISGSIPYVLGQLKTLRIPIPNSWNGQNQLYFELSPRKGSWQPKGGTTSTIFFQNGKGNRFLRLDYGFNESTKTIDYHWNQKGTNQFFKIENHAPLKNQRLAAGIYHTAKYFRRAGKVLGVFGRGADIVSIAVADKPLRRASSVVSAWALSRAGCKVTARAGAAIPHPVGKAIGIFAGCIIGGIGGYFFGEKMGGEVYDIAEETIFRPLPEINSQQAEQ